MAKRTCEVCQDEYIPSYGKQRTCSRTCGVTLRRSVTGTLPPNQWPSTKVYILTCIGCGELFVSRYAKKRKTCSARCGSPSQCIMRRYHRDSAFRATVNARAQARRASRLGLGDTHITIGYLMIRDARRCGLCGHKVVATAGPMRPSIDHITPLVLGGRHELVNVQLAHLRCNLRKNCIGAGDQLALIG